MKRRYILIAALVLMLAAVLAACDRAEPVETTTESETTDAAPTEADTTEETTEEVTTEATPSLPPYGTTVGSRCLPANLTRCGGAEGTYSIEQNAGKVTVLNFWGIWCNPCKNELPHFSKVASEMADSVTVVAVHSDQGQVYGGTTRDEYIAEHYADSKIIFCQDSAGETYYNAVGAKNGYPYTFILDANGVITHTFLGAIDEETLVNAINEAIAATAE